MIVHQRDDENLNKAKSVGWGARNGFMTLGQKEAADCVEGLRREEGRCRIKRRGEDTKGQSYSQPW